MSLASELRSYALGLLLSGISGAITGLFALVGGVTGALAGALAGRISNSSVVRGAVFGALAGSIILIEVLEAARSYCYCSEQVAARNSLSMAEFIADLLHARLVQGQLPLVTINRWQIDFTGPNSDELDDMVEEIPTKGLSPETLKKLPAHVAKETWNNSGERVCCTVCFQDIEDGEILRILPLCAHKFHLSCVDKWLLVHGSCPICRQKV